MEGAVLNGDGDLETDMPVELDAVVVVVIDVAIGALRDGAQRRPGESLGAVEELIEDGPREVVAEIHGELGETPGADVAGRELCVDVAHHRIGNSDILPDHRNEGLVVATGFSQL